MIIYIYMHGYIDTYDYLHITQIHMIIYIYNIYIYIDAYGCIYTCT